MALVKLDDEGQMQFVKVKPDGTPVGKYTLAEAESRRNDLRETVAAKVDPIGLYDEEQTRDQVESIITALINDGWVS